MAPVKRSNNITARLLDGSNTYSSNLVTLPLPGISRKARQIHFPPKMRTAALISLGDLCYDGCTITPNQKNMTAQNNVQHKLRGTRNNQTGMWKVILLTQQ